MRVCFLVSRLPLWTVSWISISLSSSLERVVAAAAGGPRELWTAIQNEMTPDATKSIKAYEASIAELVPMSDAAALRDALYAGRFVKT